MISHLSARVGHFVEFAKVRKQGRCIVQNPYYQVPSLLKYDILV